MHAKQEISQHATRMERAKPTAVLAQLREKLRGAEREVTRSLHARIAREQSSLTAVQRMLEAVSPQRVLERGFSVTLRADGGVVRRPQDVQPGDELLTRLAEGQVASRVSGSREVPRLSAKKKRPEGGPSLFDA
jgi:exodeoxyribonuclease VII large subunit